MSKPLRSSRLRSSRLRSSPGVDARVRRLLVATVTLAAVLGSVPAASALPDVVTRVPSSTPGSEDRADVQDSPSPGRVTVRVDGRAVFRLGPSQGQDGARRAARVERRLAELTQNPQAIVPVRLERSSADPANRVLSLAGVPIVTLTPDDARYNGLPIDVLGDQWRQALDREIGRSAVERATGVGRFRAEVESAVRTAFGRLWESAVRIIPRLLAATLVLGLFWLIAWSVRWVLDLTFARVAHDPTLRNLVKQVVYYSVWAVGLIVTVDALGWDPQAVATGLGLTSLVLGFALKDVLSNFVAGVLLLLGRPFKVGDQIVVGPTEGEVVRIALRATHILQYDGRAVLVPNAEVFTSRITNNTADPVRRGAVDFFVGHSSSLAEVARLAADATGAAPGVLPERPVAVRVGEIRPDGLRLDVRFWTDSRRSDYVATAAAVRAAVTERLKAANVAFSDPVTRIVLPPNPDVTDQTR